MASLLLVKTLFKLKNVLQHEGKKKGIVKGKELNVVFDNHSCGGQNKNHHMLSWLVPYYLVEAAGYFHRVNFIFLVTGHTKNAADRRFSNLQKEYRKRDICAFNDLLVVVCGKSKYVTVREPSEGW